MNHASEPEVESHDVTVRRAPRFGVFLTVGGLVGALGTLVATSLFEPNPSVGFLGSFGYFLVFGIPAGVLLGAVVAIVADSASRHRTRTATAERGVVGGPE